MRAYVLEEPGQDRLVHFSESSPEVVAQLFPGYAIKEQQALAVGPMNTYRLDLTEARDGQGEHREASKSYTRAQ